MQDIVIVGASGFAREVCWLIERINERKPSWNILGFIDNTLPVGEKIGAYSVVGNDESVMRADRKLHVAFGIGMPAIRRRLVAQYATNPNLVYPTLIDPSVIMSQSVEMGVGNVICAGVIFTVDIRIGDFNIVNLDCTIGHDAVIGSYVSVNPSVNISGNVLIHDGAEIGTGTQIIQGKCIGSGAVTGAGAVVVRDVPDDCTAVGVPAKPIKAHE